MTHYLLDGRKPIPEKLMKGKKKSSPEWKIRLKAHREHLNAIRPYNYSARNPVRHRCDPCRQGRHNECSSKESVACCGCYPCPMINTGFEVYPDDFDRDNNMAVRLSDKHD